MSTPDRCDVPEIGEYVILPANVVLPEGFARKVITFPIEAYCATVAARGGDAPLAEPTDEYSPALRKAMRTNAKGLHKVDVRAMHAAVAELKADGKSDDEIVLRLNRGETLTDGVLDSLEGAAM